jgi:hypothetical protein
MGKGRSSFSFPWWSLGFCVVWTGSRVSLKLIQPNLRSYWDCDWEICQWGWCGDKASGAEGWTIWSRTMQESQPNPQLGPKYCHLGKRAGKRGQNPPASRGCSSTRDHQRHTNPDITLARWKGWGETSEWVRTLPEETKSAGCGGAHL